MPGEPKELRVETTDAEPDHWKPGGFEPRERSILGDPQKRRCASLLTTRARPFKCAFDCVATGEPAAQI